MLWHLPASAAEADDAAELWSELRNYSSFIENAADAEEEMTRLEHKGLVRKIRLDHAKELFDHPTISKLGLLIKEKADGAKKRRVVVDALRSGANKQACCPERIVLPRPEAYIAHCGTSREQSANC